MAETHDSNRVWRFAWLVCGCAFLGAALYGATFMALGWGVMLGTGLFVLVEMFVVGALAPPKPRWPESEGYPVGGNMRAFCCPLGPPLAGAGGCGFASPDARQRKRRASTERNRGVPEDSDGNGPEVR